MIMEVIVACDFHTGAIGFKNRIPWRLPSDIEFFKKTTTNAAAGKRNMVVMGRRTWESLGCKPLPDRLNVVVSRTVCALPCEGVLYVPSLNHAIHIAQCEKSIYKLFVIGGSQLYEEALLHPLCKSVIVTYVHNHTPVEADTFFPLSVLRKYYTIRTSSPLLYDASSRLYYSIMRYKQKMI
jgi:dihydrofolate reductase